MGVDTSGGEPWGFMALQGVPLCFGTSLSPQSWQGGPTEEDLCWKSRNRIKIAVLSLLLWEMDIPGSAGLSTRSEPPGSCLDPAGVREMVVLN